MRANSLTILMKRSVQRLNFCSQDASILKYMNRVYISMYIFLTNKLKY